MTNRNNARPPESSVAAPTTRLDNTATIPAIDNQPRFAQPEVDHDPTHFRITHGSDTAAYKILDAKGRASELQPLPFPTSRGGVEPRLTLAQTLGSAGASVVQHIEAVGQIVFHALGDTGNTRGPDPQNLVAHKLDGDFSGEHPESLPRFLLHLGDVIYSFGEAQYYYDQFYEPYRAYPAPIIALAGNHDGMVAPNTSAHTLDAFLRNFCAETFQITPEAGGLDRTSQIQPGVYYTFEAPLVRILVLYSNALEDPGVISSEGGSFKTVTDVQLDYLRAALGRIAKEKFAGAVIIAHHHPAYTAGGRHGWSETLRQEIDKVCTETGVWPHAVLSAHAHNYQRFTRLHAGRAIPYIIAGNGGHGIARLTQKGEAALRVPSVIDTSGGDKVTFESYDDQGYGYLRILVDRKQLRIEYHPASDGTSAKTPDDTVTVSLATHTLVHYEAPALDSHLTAAGEASGSPPVSAMAPAGKAGHHHTPAPVSTRKRQKRS